MDAYIGEIRLFPYTFCPQNWLWCEGQTMNIMQFQALFSLIGTIYGGDGKMTFMLPDMRGQAVTAADMSNGSPTGLTPYQLNQQVGVIQVLAPLPVHNHLAVTGNAAGITPTAAPGPNSVIGLTQQNFDFTVPPVSVQMAQSLGYALGDTAKGGAPDPHGNLQPYLTLRFAICTQDGTYPDFP